MPPSFRERIHQRFANSIESPTADAPIQQLVVKFNCDDVDPEEISELLFEAGTLSVSVEVETEKSGVLNEELHWTDLAKTKSWANAILRANIPSSFNKDGLHDLLKVTYPDTSFDLQLRDVQVIDWVQHVQQSWSPQVMGDLTVRFPWHDKNDDCDSCAVVNGHELVLEGGAAFGTGDHPTTRLCCMWLQRCLKISDNGKCLRVLDYGCGSAILGLAALRFGAAEAAGTDIDLDALMSAKVNCEKNNLHMGLYMADGGVSAADTYGVENDSILMSEEEQSIISNKFRGVEASCEIPSVAQLPKDYPELFDLTVANILAPILCSLAPQLASLTKAGGMIALSGLLYQQADKVISAYEPYFAEMQVEDTEDDWVLITGIRKS